MMTKYLAFDLEIAAIIPDGETDWKQYRPLGITCVGFAHTNDNGDIRAISLCGEDIGNDTPLPRMTQADCQEVVRRLQRAVEKGYTILTWNGLSFDFDVLAEESELHNECAELAMNHVDPMFQVLCVKGFPVGLDAVSKGLGFAGKTEGMSGAQAPVLWAEGKFGEVLDYVKQDVRATLEVALEIERRKRITWLSKAGRRNTISVDRLLTAHEALQLPEPDTSWMTEPVPRARFTEWMDLSEGQQTVLM